MPQEPSARTVFAGHGHWRAMGYKFRCRIESRTRNSWFGLGRELCESRYVLEKYFLAGWEDFRWGPWTKPSKAHAAAIDLLDNIASSPADGKKYETHYIEKGNTM